MWNDMDAEEIKRGDRERSWRHQYREGGKGCWGEERRMTEGKRKCVRTEKECANVVVMERVETVIEKLNGNE